jgi:glycosyltransferase involved in cell wall biosynthesis
MDALHISAVIPLFNKEKYIERALQSILRQSVKVLDIVVVDDGSNDSGPGIVRRIAAENPAVRLVVQKNQGVSVARNRGAAEAANQLVCFLDSDDEWLPNFIEEISQLIRQSPTADAYSLRHIRVRYDGKHIRQKVSLPKGYSGTVPNFLNVYRKGYGVIHSSSVCLKKETFAKFGGFPVGARKSQDIYLWLLIGAQGEIAFRDVEAVFRHEDGSGYALRSDAVPYHVQKYMDPNHVPSYFDNEQLASFLRKSIFIMFLAEKMYGSSGNSVVVKRLLAYAWKGGFFMGLSLSALWIVPGSILRLARSFKQIFSQLRPSEY